MITRNVQSLPLQNNRYNVIVSFHDGDRVTEIHTVHTNVGPKQAKQHVETLRNVLDAAFRQGMTYKR